MTERDEGVGGANGAGGAGMPGCFFHPDREAAAFCIYCGRAICGACERGEGLVHRCPYCHLRQAAPPTVHPGTAPYPYPVYQPPQSGPCPSSRPAYAPPHPPHAVYPPPPYPPSYPPSYPPPYPGTGPYPYPAYPAAYPARRPSPQPPEPADEKEKRWWRADWSLAEVAVALVAIFGLYNVLSVILLVTTENPLFYSYLSYALFFCPLIAFSCWYIPRRHGRGRDELGLRWGRPARTALYGMAGSATAMAFSYGAYFAIYLIFYLIAGRGPVAEQTERLQEMGGAQVALVIAVVVLLAPVFEEILFRGLFYPALRRRVGPRLAVFLNGLIFGALHFQPLFMLSLVLVGIVLAYLYEKSDSLLAPMAAHSLYNLSVILISLLAGW